MRCVFLPVEYMCCTWINVEQQPFYWFMIKATFFIDRNGCFTNSFDKLINQAIRMMVYSGVFLLLNTNSERKKKWRNAKVICSFVPMKHSAHSMPIKMKTNRLLNCVWNNWLGVFVFILLCSIRMLLVLSVAAAADESRTRAHMNVNVNMKACNIFRLELFSPSMITVINHEHLMRKSRMLYVYHNKQTKITHERWPNRMYDGANFARKTLFHWT